jgi:hypothetical protein
MKSKLDIDYLFVIMMSSIFNEKILINIRKDDITIVCVIMLYSMYISCIDRQI